MDVNEAHTAMVMRRFGDEANYYDRENPRLNADGTVWLSPEDGSVLYRIPARSVIQYVATLEASEDLIAMARQMGRRETQFRLFDFTVSVTEARVFWEQNTTQTPGKRMVGHLRYPWIRAVGYRPKQSFLNDPKVTLEFMEHFPIEAQGSWFSDLDIGFDKGFDPGDLAHLIAQQAARHNLTYGCPPQIRSKVEQMAVAPRLAPPAKNAMATYFMPVHAAYPECVNYINDDRPAGRWLYQGSDDKP